MSKRTTALTPYPGACHALVRAGWRDLISNALELGTVWAQLPPATSTPSGGGRPVHVPRHRDVTSQTQTPVAPEVDASAVSKVAAHGIGTHMDTLEGQ